MLPSSFVTTSSAPASSAASISLSSGVPGANRNWPTWSNMNATEPSVPMLPPNFENAWRTSATVRIRLSVMRIDDDGRAADAVAFVADFLVVRAIDAARAALDRAVDVVLRHVGVVRLVDGEAQARIRVGVAAAHAGRDLDFLDEARPDLAALRVGRCFLMLDVGPFRMTRHYLSPSRARIWLPRACVSVCPPGPTVASGDRCVLLALTDVVGMRLLASRRSACAAERP